MREDQARGVQERPIEMRDGAQVAGHAPVDAAVERVADDRMADRAQVDADLMRPPGVDRDLRQRQHRGRSARRGRCASPPRGCAARGRFARHLLPVRSDRGRSARRCGGRPAPRPTPARGIPSRLRARETGAPAPRAPRRAWRRPSGPTCRGRADARCPAASRRRCRSDRRRDGAARSPACRWRARPPGCTTMPAGLSTTIRSRS